MSLIRKHGAVLQAWACLALVFSWSRVSGIKLPYVGQLCHPHVVSYFLFTYLTVWFINK